jgi:membrane protease subunit (stomatin/prohibitin family)
MQHGFKRSDSLASADLCGFSLKAAMKVKNAMQPVSTDSCTHRQQMQQQANSRSREWNASRIIKVNLRSMITQKSKLMN